MSRFNPFHFGSGEPRIITSARQMLSLYRGGQSATTPLCSSAQRILPFSFMLGIERMASRGFSAGSFFFYVGSFTVAAKRDLTRCFNGWTAACEQALAWYSMPWGGVNVSLVGSCLGGWRCGEVISEGAAILQQEIVDDLLRSAGCEMRIYVQLPRA